MGCWSLVPGRFRDHRPFLGIKEDGGFEGSAVGGAGEGLGGEGRIGMPQKGLECTRRDESRASVHRGWRSYAPLRRCRSGSQSRLTDLRAYS